MVTIDGYEDVPADDAAALKKAVANQPVSVAICANSRLQLYSKGVFSEGECCDQLNHGVLAVGCAAMRSRPPAPSVSAAALPFLPPLRLGGTWHCACLSTLVCKTSVGSPPQGGAPQ